MSTRDKEIILLQDAGHVGSYSDMLYNDLTVSTSRSDSMNDLWLTLFSDGGITTGGFNDRMLAHLQAIGATSDRMSTAYTEVIDSGTLPSNPTAPILATDHPNLVAMYTMDNRSGYTLVDESPNNIDLPSGSGITTVAGKIGSATQGDGVSASVYTTSTVDIAKFFSSAGAMCLWIKADPAVSAFFSFANSGNTSGQMGFNIGTNFGGRKPNIFLSDSGYVRNNFVDFDLSVGTDWHFIVFQSDGAVFTASADGVPVNVDVLSALSNDGRWMGDFVLRGSWDRFGIHALLDSTPAFSTSPIDQIRFFDRLLTPTEITALFDEGTP